MMEREGGVDGTTALPPFKGYLSISKRTSGDEFSR